MSLAFFALLFFTLSITPGPNMLLAMSFAMSAGWKKTMPLIFGAVLGLVLVGFVCGLGVGVIFSANELVFTVFMCACACYLIFLAFNIYKNAKNFEFNAQDTKARTSKLFIYGFMSCISNAKAWAAFVALLPPFLNRSDPLDLNFVLILSLIALIEFTDMCLYMFGGLMLRKFLAKRAVLIQKLSALLIVLVALMMIFGVLLSEVQL
ncbi:LysE family translocator [Campylobacter troglodytis]|uniref:LysE family translocator n=1 Tax=Campylobacter troglodytis TaxID=654363 RepID=UPI001156CEF9|nr:LysE family translocator [Campylobacter troglodytis]TQR57285.1 hypothetical protein DMC01_08650 [Campylobacter troglodytis]